MPSSPSPGMRRLGARLARPLVVPVVLAWCLLLLGATGVAAHAGVVLTDPVDGARLPASPQVVMVRFSEPVTLAPGGLRVVRPDGSLADIGPETLTGTDVRQAIEPLADGWYVMAWSIVSADGHPLHGSVTFAVGDADEAVRPLPPDIPSALETAEWLTRGIADLAMLAGVGALFAWVALGARTRRVAMLRSGALVLAAVGVVAWLGVEVTDAGTGWLSTVHALAAIARAALLVLAVVLLHVRPARERGALLSAALALATLAIGGHATGSPLTSLTLAVHLLAGITWLGAAPAVALVLRDRSVPDEPDALDTVRRFSRTATLTLVLVFGGGVASALLLTNGLESGLTVYVWIALAKLAVVGLAALLGFLGRRGLTAGAGRSRYRRLFLTDGLLLIVVAGLSAALTLVGPHEGAAGHDGHDRRAPRCALSLSSGGAAVVLDPGRPGTNAVGVTGPATDVREVRLSLAHEFAGGAATEVTLEPTDGTWTGSVVLPFTGDWTATLAVRLDAFTEQQGSCTIPVSP